MEAIEEIKKLLKSKQAIIGTERVMKHLKAGRMAKVFLSSNCSKEAKEDIGAYAKLAQAEVIQLGIPNDELGVLCKKPFSIAVIGIVK